MLGKIHEKKKKKYVVLLLPRAMPIRLHNCGFRFGLELNGPVNTIKVIVRWSVNLTILFQGRLSPQNS